MIDPQEELFTLAQKDILLAQEAMDNGSDDSRWIPGETAVVALIRERDKYRAIVHQHNLCHDMHGKVGAKEFAQGCDAEQRKLYGCAPHADEIENLRATLEVMAGSLNAFLNKRRDDAPLSAEAHLEEMRLGLEQYRNNGKSYSSKATELRMKLWELYNKQYKPT
jgi:hypothetical protein